MDRFLMAVTLLALATTAAILALHLRRAAAARAARRGGYLDACRALVTAPRGGRGASGFARLGGHYRGHEADIQVLPDTLTFRKLPALWVLVTLPGPMPVEATFDLMIRPMGVEPFSRFHTLPHQVSRPDGFPEDCAIRTDAPARLLPQAILRAHLHIFDDPKVKELVISPKGVRLVFLADEAQRSRYLIYRDAEMGLVPLSPATLAPQLDALIALRAAVLDAATPDMQKRTA